MRSPCGNWLLQNELLWGQGQKNKDEQTEPVTQITDIWSLYSLWSVKYNTTQAKGQNDIKEMTMHYV